MSEKAYLLKSTHGFNVSCDVVLDLRLTQEETDNWVAIYRQLLEYINNKNNASL